MISKRWLALLAVVLLPLSAWNLRNAFAVREKLKESYAASPAEAVYGNSPERARVLRLIARIRGESDMLQTENEAYQIYMAVQRTRKVPGDVVEVGVYRGGSAKLICEVKGDAPLHLFDTFEGIPETGKLDTWVSKGKYAASLEGVKAYLKDCPQTYFYKGWFPSTAGPIENKKFSFVHLDVDTYQSTLDSLKFFYPRMNRGGVIMSHDYITFEGVRSAVDQFFADKPEPVLELSGSQCLIIRL